MTAKIKLVLDPERSEPKTRYNPGTRVYNVLVDGEYAGWVGKGDGYGRSYYPWKAVSDVVRNAAGTKLAGEVFESRKQGVEWVVEWFLAEGPVS